MLYGELYQGLYFEMYGLLFALELLLSLIPFIIYLPKRRLFGGRFVAGISIYTMLVTLYWLVIRTINDGKPSYNVPFFLGVTLFLGLLTYGCCETNVFGALNYATGAYAVQNASYSISNIIKNAFSIELSPALSLIVFDVLMYILVCIVFFFTLIYPMRKKMNGKVYDIRAFFIAVSILVVCVILSSQSDNLFGEYIQNNVDVMHMRLYCNIYSFIGCFSCIVIQFGFQRENRLTDEKEILQKLMHSEKKSHEMSKDVIDIINKKSHDLKHQLIILEQLGDKEEIKGYVDELKENLAVYDSVVKTGNDALDIVIAEKNLVCIKNDIAFSYLVDGKALSFMSTADVASLFGNALDNAIERLKTEPTEHRFIDLSAKIKSGFVYIHLDNYCSGGVEFDSGMPRSTKGDDDYHGFGTKSMKSVVEKYGGEIMMGMDDDKFELDVLLPKPNV